MARIEALNAHDPLLSQAIAEGVQEAKFDKSVIHTAAPAAAMSATTMGAAGGADMSAGMSPAGAIS